MTKKQRQARVRKIVEYLQNYMNTYSDQPYYEDYSDDTIIHDVLYGLGIALDRRNNFGAGGYEKFKKELLLYLVKEL